MSTCPYPCSVDIIQSSVTSKRERENGTSRIKTKFTIFFDFQVEKSATENEPLLFDSCRYYVDQLKAS